MRSKIRLMQAATAMVMTKLQLGNRQTVELFFNNKELNNRTPTIAIVYVALRKTGPYVW